MNCTLKGSIRFATLILVSVFFASGVSQAQSNSGQHSTPWGDAAKKQGSNQGDNQASAPPKAPESPPAQVTSVAPSATPEGDPGSCRYSTPEDETFLCKMIRIFYGPDTPRGPSRDVEENVSAGGAGG